MAIKPPVQWAQRTSQVFLHVDVADLKDCKFELDEANNKLVFSAASAGKSYSFEIEFFGPVQKEGSVHIVHGKGTDMVIAKKDGKDHWPRLTKEKAKYNWLSVDWGKFVDEDDETPAKSQFDMSGFDPSQMGDFMQGYNGGGMNFGDDGGDDGDDGDEGDMEAAD